MALTIVVFLLTLQTSYANGITSIEKINIHVDELHSMLFHKITLELGVENVDTFRCRVNKKGIFYMLNTDSDVLNFLNGLNGADFVDILVLPSTNVDVSSSPQKDNVDVSSSPHKNRVDLSSSPQIDRANVSSFEPFDENENRNLNQNQSLIVEEQFPRVEEQAPTPRVEEHSDSYSLYDVDENIDDLSDLDKELLQARQSNIQEQVKENADRVNIDEIPSGPVGIDAGFEDIYKEKRGRFEGNLGGDDPYFNSSDPGSDISEDEGDPVENDEVVDPAPRKESTKIYFDPTAKKKGVNIKLKPNEKERIRAKCKKKGCPWHILGSIDGNTGKFSIQSLIQKQYGLYVSKTSCRKAKLRVMNEHMGDFKEEFARLYDYTEQLKTTNPETNVSIRTSKNTIPGKKVFMSIYICLGSLKNGWKEECRRIIGLDGAFLKSVCKGELLSCISKDGNNQMYPIAWPVVDKETKDTWS
ncbi:hypothetical protein H5410_027669 [Solanum commersonii]|uniref:Transposase MuDR plant domain-containing protein n=1 Tax=Solanum commersonii TaxID=4109 RepID=A0A9J5YZU1_SOLCO|nr:hypothetical protein H5410_027669 [Solanum commersonii]